ncbi:MAG TPA: DsbA family protein [Nitrospira sp.]|nr:DsbA family protein [Nitrospira sp.]
MQVSAPAGKTRYLLYSDFNCPFCYALHERLHGMKLLDRCDWRGVQHAPYLPRPMKPWQGTLEAELRHEIAIVQRLAPRLPIALPKGKPNTRPAIETAISILRPDRDQGLALVGNLYRAFWVDGRDISDAAVLAELAGKVPDGDSASIQIAHEWEKAWHATGQAGVPLIVSPDGALLVGCVPEEAIRRFFS